MKNNITVERLLPILLFGLFVFLSFNRHSRVDPYYYQSEVWADKGGYYVYNPAAFNYEFNAEKFPAGVDTMVGHGFIFKQPGNKVVTKYPIGVAILQSPFYNLANLIYSINPCGIWGFSVLYFRMINVAAAFYLVLGLVFLFRILSSRYKKGYVFFALSSIVLGTNLYYYAVDETGMSHIYSFFAFSSLLYMLTVQWNPQKILWGLVLGFLLGLLLVLRPSNILFIPLLFYISWIWRQSSPFAELLRLRPVITIILGAVIPIFLQMAYWKYAYGSWIYYSYENEGFNFLNPQIKAFLFAPNNGMLLYNPLYALLLLLPLFFSRQWSLKQRLPLVIYTLGVIYIFASWWAFNFGCGYGSRNMVEYLAPLSIIWVDALSGLGRRKLGMVITFVLVLFLSVLNLGQIYSYDECYYGIGHWDWEYYGNYLLKVRETLGFK